MPARGYYKKLKTRVSFPDFWHTARGHRNDKKLCVQTERQQLKRETEQEKTEETELYENFQKPGSSDGQPGL